MDQRFLSTPEGNLYPDPDSGYDQSQAFRTVAYSRDVKDRNTDQAHSIFSESIAAQEAQLTEQGFRISSSEYVLKTLEGQVHDTYQAALQAGEDATASSISADGAWAANAELTPRVEHIETIAGLSPGDVTDAQTANLVAQPGTDTRGVLNSSFAARASVTRHVRDFGAIGDGATDDTAALQAALESGEQLNFGGPERVYKITAALASPPAFQQIVWTGGGATIDAHFTESMQYGIFIDSNERDVKISGMSFNFRRNAFTGIYISNNTTTNADLILNNISVTNVRRADTSMTGGDGILIAGAFERVSINHPIIQQVTMAEGAGIRGIQGISGITVKSHGPDRYPKQVTITDPFIDGVYSEDNTYLVDQDGIKLFAAEDIDGNLVPYESHFNVSAGTLRNCVGRALKSQMEWGVVDGMKVYRDRVKEPGATDIDFQVGGGIASNIEMHYHGSAPIAAVGFSRPSTDGKLVAHGSVNNLRILTTGDAELPQAVLFNQRTTYPTTSYLTVRGVEVIGNPVRQVVRMNGVAGGQHHLAVSDVFAAPAVALVSGGSGTARWFGTVMASNCLNTGPHPVHLFEAASSTAAPQVTANGCLNWTPQKYINRGTAGPTLRVESIAPSDVVDSGVLRPVAYRLQNGEIGEFPESFALGNTGMLIVSVGHSRHDQGIFVCDASQVEKLSTAGTSFSVGANTEPASGNYRLWVDPATETVRISNRSGSARTVTVLMFG